MNSVSSRTVSSSASHAVESDSSLRMREPLAELRARVPERDLLAEAERAPPEIELDVMLTLLWIYCGHKGRSEAAQKVSEFSAQ